MLICPNSRYKWVMLVPTKLLHAKMISQRRNHLNLPAVFHEDFCQVRSKKLSFEAKARQYPLWVEQIAGCELYKHLHSYVEKLPQRHYLLALQALRVLAMFSRPSHNCHSDICIIRWICFIQFKSRVVRRQIKQKTKMSKRRILIITLSICKALANSTPETESIKSFKAYHRYA